MKSREQVLENTIKQCREQHIILPTYKQMKNPELIPEKIKDKLKKYSGKIIDFLKVSKVPKKQGDL